MAITFTSGLEPKIYHTDSFNLVKESERRAAEFLQGTGGFFNPLEIERMVSRITPGSTPRFVLGV